MREPGIETEDKVISLTLCLKSIFHFLVFAVPVLPTSESGRFV